MNISSPSETIFHSIEKTIKTYRKFSQRNLSSQVEDMTIDQGLVLTFIDKHPEMSQKEIAALAFKDTASMTRIINLMVKKEYLKRSINELNRRRYKIEITPKGRQVLQSLGPIVLNNRETALETITEKELIQLENILKKITSNCINS